MCIERYIDEDDIDELIHHGFYLKDGIGKHISYAFDEAVKVGNIEAVGYIMDSCFLTEKFDIFKHVELYSPKGRKDELLNAVRKSISSHIEWAIEKDKIDHHNIHWIFANIPEKIDNCLFNASIRNGGSKNIKQTLTLAKEYNIKYTIVSALEASIEYECERHITDILIKMLKKYIRELKGKQNAELDHDMNSESDSDSNNSGSDSNNGDELALIQPLKKKLKI